jgi:hypothetical protein
MAAARKPSKTEKPVVYRRDRHHPLYGRTDEQKFKDAVRDCGILPKGEPLARAIWNAVAEAFKAVEAQEGPIDDPFGDAFDFIGRLLRAKAADIALDNRLAAWEVERKKILATRKRKKS